MILADKLIELRKKKGLSQEELAEILGVSRQSVSKWESAQCAPELNKLIQLSDIYGVSLDYLLKEGTEEALDKIKDEEEKNDLIALSINDTRSFIKYSKKSAWMLSLAAAFCILGPVIGLSIIHAYFNKRIDLNIYLSVAVCLAVALTFLAVSIVLFCLALNKKSKFTMLFNKPFKLEKEAEEYLISDMKITAKICLILKIACIVFSISVVILICIGALSIMSVDWDSFESILSAFVFLACALAALISRSILQNAYNTMFANGNEGKRASQKRNAIVLSIFYWMIIALIFSIAGLVSKSWFFSWVLLIFAVIIYMSLIFVLIYFDRANKKNTR